MEGGGGANSGVLPDPQAGHDARTPDGVSAAEAGPSAPRGEDVAEGPAAAAPDTERVVMHEDTHALLKQIDEHDAASTHLCGVAQDVASVALMRRNCDLSMPTSIHVAFPAPYVRNPTSIFVIEIQLARPWRDDDLKSDEKKALEDDLKKKCEKLPHNHRDKSKRGMRAITVDACLCLSHTGVGDFECIPHSCFHKDPLVRFSEGAGSTKFLESLVLSDHGPVADLAHGGNGIAEECVRQRSRLPMDQLLLVSNAVRAMSHALHGSLKGGSSQSGPGRRNLPPLYSVSRAWRRDDKSRKRVHNHWRDVSPEMYKKYVSGTKLDVVIHAQLVPDMAAMVVTSAHASLLKNKYKVPIVDESASTPEPQLPRDVGAVFTSAPRTKKNKDGKWYPQLGGRSYLFFDAVSKGGLLTSEVWVFAEDVLGLVCPAVATAGYCESGQKMLETGDGRPNWYHRQLFGGPFSGSPRYQRRVLEMAPNDDAREIRRSGLCDVFLLPLSVLDEEKYKEYRSLFYRGVDKFELLLNKPENKRGVLGELLDHYPEAVGEALPSLQIIFMRVLTGDWGCDSLVRLREWDSRVKQGKGRSNINPSGHQPKEWTEVANVLKVALGIENLAKMLVKDPEGAHKFDMGSVPKFIKRALKEICDHLLRRLGTHKLRRPVTPRDALCFLLQPLATFALEWTQTQLIPQGFSVMFDFFEASQDVRDGKVLHPEVVEIWAKVLRVGDLDAICDSNPFDSRVLTGVVREGERDLAGGNEEDATLQDSDGVPRPGAACGTTGSADAAIVGPRRSARIAAAEGSSEPASTPRGPDVAADDVAVAGEEEEKSPARTVSSPSPNVVSDVGGDGTIESRRRGDVGMKDTAEAEVDATVDPHALADDGSVVATGIEPARRDQVVEATFWRPQEAMAHRLGASRMVNEKVQAHVACEDALKWAVLHAKWGDLVAKAAANKFEPWEQAEHAMLESAFGSRADYARMAASSLWCEVEAGIASACAEAAGRLAGAAETADDENAVVPFRIKTEERECLEPACKPCMWRRRQDAASHLPITVEPDPEMPKDLGLHSMKLVVEHGPRWRGQAGRDARCPSSISAGNLVLIRVHKDNTVDDQQVLIGFVEDRRNASLGHVTDVRGNTSSTSGSVELVVSVSSTVKDFLKNESGDALRRQLKQWDCEGTQGSLTSIFQLRPALAVLRVLKCVEEGKYKSSTAPELLRKKPLPGSSETSSTDYSTTQKSHCFMQAMDDKAELMRHPEALFKPSGSVSLPLRRSRPLVTTPPDVTTPSEKRSVRHKFWREVKRRAELAKDFCDRCAAEDEADPAEDPQQRVLRELMYCNVVESDHKDGGMSRPAVVVAQGPPGSGKSRVAHRVVNLHLLFNHALAQVKDVQHMWLTNRVLIVAERNSAVDDCLSAILNGEPFVDSSGVRMPKPRCLRLGPGNDRTSTDLQAVRLEWLLDHPMEEWPEEWRKGNPVWRTRGKGKGVGELTAFRKLRELEEENTRRRNLAAQDESEINVEDWRESHEWQTDWYRGVGESRRGMMSSGRASHRRSPGAKSKRKPEEWAARNKLKEHLLSMAHVVGVTIGSMQHGALDHGPSFQHVIYEEASLSTEPSLAYVLFRLFDGEAPRSYLLVGDGAQGLPFIHSKVPKARARLTLSPFSRLFSGMGSHAHLFSLQYRMASEIWELNNDLFYNGKVKDGLPEREFIRDFVKDPTGRFGPVLVLDTSVDAAGCSFREGTRGGTTSRYNEGEAQVVVAVLRCLVQLYPSRRKVLVLSHYLAQVKLLKELLQKDELIAASRYEVIVDTVDSAQGKQADITIYSLTRSHSGQGDPEPPQARSDVLKFINNKHAVNVATTRSRYALIVVGNVKFIEERSAEGCCWTKFFAHYRKKRYIRSAKYFQEVYWEAACFDRDPMRTTNDRWLSVPAFTRLSL